MNYQYPQVLEKIKMRMNVKIQLALTLVFFLGCLVVLSQPTDYVAYYPFSGNVNDASGNGNNGTLVSSASVTGDELLIPSDNTSALSIPHTVMNGLTDFSFSVWGHLNAVSAYPTLLSAARTAEQNALSFSYNGSIDSWEIVEEASATVLSANAEIEDLNRHHIVLTREGTTAKLFLDGVQISGDVTVSGATINIESSGLIVGQEQDNLGGGFQLSDTWGGTIDNVRIYNRALSISEISSIYASESGVPTITSISPTSGPVGTLVTIAGTNLDNPTSLQIAGTDALEISNDGTTLVGFVMPGATSGSVDVTTAGGSVSSTQTFTVITPSPASALQIGSDIDGESAGDGSGTSVSLSADGQILAIGANGNDGSGGNAGHVRVYQNNAGTWSQIGSDIDGEAAGDFSGYSVSLSADGQTLAIGAYLNDGTGSGAGHVQVYENTAGTWSQIGSDIDGEAAGDQSGKSVSLSADGQTLAIGAVRNDDGGADAGQVRVYENNAGTWTQIGADIDGEAAGDGFGGSVSLSADGQTVAIGAVGNYGTGSIAGHVRVYQNNAGTWSQIGADIDGEAVEDQSGFSVSLSADGQMLAIGAFLNDGTGINAGHVRVYQNNAGTWDQVGSDIDGEDAGDRTGSSVSLSADGQTLAIGAYNNDGTGSNAGHVRVYENTSGTWSQVGSDLDGEAVGDNLGWSVSLSADGQTLVIGAPLNDGTGTDAGHVRVYDLGDGFVASYTFDGNTTDQSGNGNDATNNGATQAADRLAASNKALSFDGDDYVLMNNQVTTAPDVFTLVTWFKYSGNGGNIIGYGDNNADPSQWDRYVSVNADGLVTFYVSPGSAKSINSTSLLYGNEWYQVAATLSPDGMKLYVNGVEEASDNSVTSGEALPGYWRFGRTFTGSIDDSRIYDRALSATEIANIYASETESGTDVTSWSFSSFTGTIDNSNKTIAVTVDHGVDLHTLVPTFELSTGAIAVANNAVLTSGSSEINMENQQTITVRALNRTEQNWTLTVTQNHPTSIHYQKLSNVPILSLAEGVASGFMWGDVNGDKYPDVMMTEYGNPGTTQLFFNDQSLSFTDQSSKLDSDGDANFVDYDNDGDLDILTIDESTTVRIIFENDGAGNFTRVSGLFGSPGTYQFNTAVADYDNDGDLDFYMLNENNNSSVNTLFQNNGDRTFTEITAGDHVTEGEKSLDASFIDYDYDGDADLFVSNNNSENNSAYLNNGDGTFTQATGGLFISGNINTEGQSWMDFNDDGFIDLYETVADGPDNFYQNNGDGTFTDISTTLGDGNTNSAAAAWGDYDNDGDPDLFIATSGSNLNRLFSNDGDGTFTEITSTLINEVSDASSGNFVDFNLDGGLDISVTNWSYDNYLYYNSGNSNNYFGVRLTGVESNKTAIGARLRMVSKVDGTNDLTQYRTVIHTHGRRAQNGYAQHFGVGAATAIDSLEIWWPSGTYQLILNTNVNDYLDVTEQSSVAQITEFVVTDQVSAAIDESAKTITIVVPTGTDLTTVSPTITISTDASVSPNSGVSQDFSNAVTYTVTAEDGTTTQDYVVSIDDELNTANDILTFVVTDQISSTIDESANTVTVVVPLGTDLTAISPTVTVSTDASVSPNSDVSQDFTIAVTYTVTAEDGSTKDYAVTVDDELNTANDILIFDITNQSGTSAIDATNYTVELTMPNGTDLTILSPTITLSENATISPLSGVSVDFTSAVTYSVSAEDETVQDWSVSVFELPIVDDSLVAYFPFTGSAEDRSGNGYDPTVVGATLSDDRSGIERAAYTFNGSDNYMTIPATAGYSGISSEMSISVWINVTSDSSDPPIFGNQDFASNTGFLLRVNATEFQWEVDNVTPENLNGGTVVPNEWTHIVVTYKSGDANRLYVNGVLVAEEIASSEGVQISNFPMVIGTLPWDVGSQNFPGQIDDLRVYNKALSTTEINGIYNTEAATGLVAYYPFNGNDNDESGNNFNPTSNSATLGLDRYNNATSAYSFDGVDDNILASGIPTVSNFTVSGWLQTEVNDTYQIIADLEGFFGLATKDDSLIAVLRTNVDGFYEVIKDQSFPSDGRWHHFVATYNGSLFGLYMDGDSIAGASVSSIYHELDPMNLRIGSNANAAWWNGSLDEIRLHNKSLSTAEILALYNEEKPPFSSENDMLTFSFSEQSGDATIDATNHTVDIYVVNGSGLSSLAPTITVSDNASVSPGSGVSADFSSDATYTVIAEDGTTQDWTVSVVELPIVSDGLIAYYPFDGNADDYSGNEYHGIPGGDSDGPSGLIADRNGTENMAYQFDGFDDFIKASDFDFNNDVGTVFTFNTWVYLDKHPSEIVVLLAGKASLSLDSSGKLFFIDISTQTATAVVSNASLAVGQWSMVSAVFTSGTVRFYINGELDGFFNVSVEDIGPSDLYIGGIETNESGTAYFEGNLDDVRVYNRTLSATEISQIYNNEAQTGLVAYYPFNGNDNDESGNNFNPTSNSATLGLDRYNNATSAYFFDGVDDNILASGIPTVSNFTVSGWLQTEVNDTYQIIADLEGFFGLATQNDSLVSVLRTDADGVYSVIKGPVNLDGKWHHTAVSYDGAVYKLYLDGDSLSGANLSTIFHEFNPMNLRIGSNSNAAWWNGSLDEIRLHNKALSSIEIANFYNEEKPPFSSENNILTFSFAEQTGAATINATNHTVEIEVARNTDLTSLIPTITVSDNAGISPASGVAVDFSDGETYTVTAEDGTLQNWTVTVTEEIIGAEGLIAYYPFNGNANDEGGIGLNGGLRPIATFTEESFVPDRYELLSSALEFNGVDEYADVPSGSFNLFSSGSLSFSCWVKINSLENDGQGQFLIHSSQARLWEIGGKFSFEIYNSETLEGVGATSSFPLNESDWVHFFGTYDGQNVILYFNGKPDASFAANLELRDIPSNITLGSTGDEKYFNGILDEVRIYGRALAASEVLDIYNAEKVSALPTDISLSFSEISENQAVGTFVGTFSTTDSDDETGHTYKLNSGSDNFSISNDTLYSAATFEFDGENAITSYLINVRTIDPAGGDFDKEFTITILDEDEENNDAPTDILLSSNTAPEGDDDWLVGNLSTVDPDNEEFTYTLTEGATTEFKLVNGNQLFTAVALDFESQSNYSLTVESSDGELFVDKTFTIEVLDVGPVFSNPPSITEYELGGDGVDVSIDVSSDDPIEKVDIVYRKLSSSTEIRSTLTADGSTYIHAFSDGDFDASGIQFKFEATVTTDNVALTESSNFFSIGANSPEVSVPVSSDGGTSVTLYRVLAFPYDEPNASAYFGNQGSAGEDYRVFTWNPSSSSYGEYPTAFNNVQPGRGYFFISKEAPNLNAGGKSVNVTNGEFTLSQTLQPGYNQIGNPFLANIDWSAVVAYNIANDVLSQEEAGELLKYTGSWVDNQSTINTYEGAFFQVAGTNAIPGFKIPVSAISGGGRVADPVLRPKYVNLDRRDWQLRFYIYGQDVSYNIGGFGIHPESASILDKYDRGQAPRLSKFIETHFSSGERKSIKPKDAITSWSFNVVHNLEGGDLTLRWDLAESSYENLIMVDRSNRRVIDMEQVRKMSIDSDYAGTLEVYFGEESEIMTSLDLEGIFFNSIYPNPGEAEVNLQLFSDGERTIDVSLYDLSGRTISLGTAALSKGMNQINYGLINQEIPGGVYQLVVESQDVTPIFIKFIKH